jgi:hypothetical protein
VNSFNTSYTKGAEPIGSHTLNSSSMRTIIHPDILRKEMMAAGERLNAALNLECELSWLITRNEGENLVDQWNECRHSVRRFSEDYALAAESYRTAVKNAIAGERGTLKLQRTSETVRS